MKRVFEIDNPMEYLYGQTLQVVTKGKKAIIIPAGAKLIPTKGYIPHIETPRIKCRAKYCHACKKWLFLPAFIKNKHSADGYKDTCSKCDNKRRRARYAKTKAVT